MSFAKIRWDLAKIDIFSVQCGDKVLCVTVFEFSVSYWRGVC